MEKFTINGVEFNNFGENNYSNGMQLITTTRSQMNIPMASLIEQVLRGEFRGVYLNPSAPCNIEEFFGVLGTKEQYEEFYQSQRESQISKKMIEKFGWNNWPDKEITEKYEDELRRNYKDWWEE